MTSIKSSLYKAYFLIHRACTKVLAFVHNLLVKLANRLRLIGKGMLEKEKEMLMRLVSMAAASESPQRS